MPKLQVNNKAHTSYSIRIGSKMAREANLINEDGTGKEYIIEVRNGEIVIKAKDEG